MASRAPIGTAYSAANNDLVVLDLHRLREITDGDREFERELIDTFKESALNILAQLRTCLMAGDAEGIARYAHALKGACINVGASGMAKCANRIESAARAGKLGPSRDCVDALVAEEQALWWEFARR